MKTARHTEKIMPGLGISMIGRGMRSFRLARVRVGYWMKILACG